MEKKRQCNRCGDTLTLINMSATDACYKCRSCGTNITVPMTKEVEDEYYQRRYELSSRINASILDWRGAHWDKLYRELTDFLDSFSPAKDDIQLQLGLVACITNGFQFIDKEKYRRCKTVYKVTERLYKRQLKSLKRNSDQKLQQTLDNYRELRAKYKKCRSEYLHTKLIWKLIFSVFDFLKAFIKLPI